MKITNAVTFLAVTVLSLVSSFYTTAFAAGASSNTLKKAQVLNQNQTVLSADRVEKFEETQPMDFAIMATVSRSTSLVDFKDGSRHDGMDYMLIPAFKMKYGQVSAKIAYSQNLRDTETSSAKEDSDFADIPFTFAFNPYNWKWSPPYIVAITPTITMVAPVSQQSTQKDQLQTAVIGGISFAIIPDGIAPKKDGAFNLALGVTAGRSFHPYEEDINGTVLNKYSSNQTVNLGYTYKNFSIGTEYIHKTRWTYQGNVRDAFELSEEIGYAINDHFTAAIGHTNGGSGLKEDGTESNFRVVNENDSTVYVQMGVSF